MARRVSRKEPEAPGPTYSITVRAQYPNKVGMLARVASAIGGAGGDIGAIDIVQVGRGGVIRDITVSVRDDRHGREVVKAVRAIPSVTVRSVSDPLFLMHLGGKIEIHSKVPLTTRRDMSMAYTPGVGRISMAVNRDPPSVWALTIKANTIAVVSDGTAVLGLGDIGPEAALPVMEGKALLFKAFGGVDAWPICLATKDPDEIVDAVKYIAPGFGGINLEDISAPRCFYIEDRLKKELDIPVFHDDQHGTAVVVMAGLINALKIVKKELQDLRVVLSGVGAGGIACTKMLLSQGVKNIIGCDRAGAVYKGRKENMNDAKKWFADNSNPERMRGTLSEAMEGADFFLGLSAPDILTADDLKKMNRDPIVFAMSNPDPEIRPEEALPHVRVMATGRSDYPNQVNNVLCFPGLFRGVLDARARDINEDMKLAAAHAIADTVSKSELNEEYIIPSVFNRSVFRNIAREVEKAAYDSGVAERHRRAQAAYY